ncbi:hypothetical protein LC040_11205 [Bacillus tianshenii]|nr:hypothetical protein LC040_11205 [Bacillus tianshenii]
MKKLTKKTGLQLRLMLIAVMLIAPIASGLRLFPGSVLVFFYIVSAVCLIGLFVVEFNTDK